MCRHVQRRSAGHPRCRRPRSWRVTPRRWTSPASVCCAAVDGSGATCRSPPSRGGWAYVVSSQLCLNRPLAQPRPGERMSVAKLLGILKGQEQAATTPSANTETVRKIVREGPWFVVSRCCSDPGVETSLHQMVVVLPVPGVPRGRVALAA